jgi:hypothetical protein
MSLFFPRCPHNRPLRQPTGDQTSGYGRYGHFRSAGIRVFHEREAGRLHVLSMHDIPLQRELKLVWDKRHPLTPIARAFWAGQFPHLLTLSPEIATESSETTLRSCQRIR